MRVSTQTEGAVSDFTAFGALERKGWSDAARARGYVELFASASDQAISRLLNSVDAKSNHRVLDLCCGQGNVSEALARRGCQVVGVDFSPAMLRLAHERVPNATFIEADVQDLPLDDTMFDIVVSNLGLCHVPDQPRALSEARRMLRPGGKFAMTVWCGPDVSPCLELVYGMIKRYGSADVSAPPGPDFHQFAQRAVAEKLLSGAGFSDIELEIVDCAWNLDTPGGLSEIYEKGTVRAAMVLSRQSPQDLAAIRSALAHAVEQKFANGERWRVPVPAALIRAGVPLSAGASRVPIWPPRRPHRCRRLEARRRPGA
jgi:SAM-dependent methyltransferase